ncbi:MarR family transcriptional regulator [uncultured Amnibacterium sp.]|uniref:MarR family transcriptional regulator n=1 Tax=uncultured Amnibacterium sp. TaxID=1631851 RepID=UPI0035CA4464
MIREVALQATSNTGSDRVNAGELAVLEDIARHPRATIGEITDRTALAQSLVSRIVQTASTTGALTVDQDEADRRKVRVSLSATTREAILDRAASSTDSAVLAHTPALTKKERAQLNHHLSQAAALFRRGGSGESPVQP